MNYRKYLTVFCATMLCTVFFVSCDDDDNNSGESDPTPITTSFFILNRGNDGSNNASLAFYDATTGMLEDKFYEKANDGSGLGDSAEDMLIYGSKTYVSVTSSNRLAILDQSGKLIKAIEPKNESGEPMRPRYLAANKDKIYMSYYYGHSVAVLDTASLEVEKVIPVGRYPEQIVISGDKLYAANSGGLDYPNYGKTVSVINLNSLEVVKNIDVVLNPTSLEANANGDVYVISMGDYGDIPNTLQCINGNTDEVKTIGKGSRMDLVGNSLYVLYAQYGEQETICVFKYNALTGELENDNLVPEISKISTKNSLNIKADSDGSIYITDAPYTETGTVHVFDKSGVEMSGSPVDTKGYGPNTLWIVK